MRLVATEYALVDADHEWLVIVRGDETPVYAVMARCGNKYDAQLVLDALRISHGRSEA